MKIAIVGYSVEGRASYEHFKARGHELTICDRDADLVVPEGAATALGDSYLDDLDRFDLIMRTAGLPPQLILDKNPGVGGKITTHTNEFMRVCPTRNIIGVTGTKGKGTTSTLIAKMLEAAGKNVYLGGNIGLPPLSFLKQLTPESWVVLELSSFQLIDLKTSPHIGVCLMVVPEHLNWHKDLDEYVQAKTQLFAHQKSDDLAIYFAENETSRQIGAASPGRKIPYYAEPGAHIENGQIIMAGQAICKTDELKLPGKHNWQNACAAVTAIWQVTQDVAALRSVLTTFSGLEHRLQMVSEIDRVRYYDDSFGTTPETTMVAIQAFNEPEILILGGRGKGIPFTELAQTIAAGPNVKKVIVIGETAGEISSELQAAGYSDIVQGGKTMEEIVGQARQLAEPGDVVLLSTACASFDMFESYKDRGEKFTAAVQALA